MSFESLYDMFFGAELTWYACLMRIMLSFIAGIVLGIERKMRQQFVGMRTLLLICVSSTLLMLLSIYSATMLPGGTGDPSRIAAQVVSGIGFLGAGTIIRQGLNIKGLTSSAIIWAVAALGLAIGAGLIFPALVALVLFVLALVFLEKLEEQYFPSGRSKKLNLVFANNKIDIDALTKLINSQGVSIINTDVTRVLKQKQILISFLVRVPPAIDIFNIIDKIKTIGRLEEFRLTD